VAGSWACACAIYSLAARPAGLPAGSRPRIASTPPSRSTAVIGLTFTIVIWRVVGAALWRPQLAKDFFAAERGGICARMRANNRAQQPENCDLRAAVSRIGRMPA